jgi:flagellin-like hook-associated protein FlgL
MPIVLNTNASATEATFNLNQANDNLRRSIARLSSGSRITKPTDDAGGLAVAYKLRSSISRTEAALNNHQNALSYLQVQDGVLEAMGDIVDRMAELRTLASDVSKSISDIENYSKEFVELQDQLNQMKREKFNGVELFATEEEWETMEGLNKSHLKINGQDYKAGQSAFGTKEKYEYFDDPDENNRTISEYDKYEFQLYTHPTGQEQDGNIKLNIVNLQFMLGIKNPNEQFGVEYNLDRNYDGEITADGAGSEWALSTYDRDGDGTFSGTELADSGLDVNGDGEITLAGDGSKWTAYGWKQSGYDDGTGGGTANDGVIDAGEWTASGYDLNGDGIITDAAALAASPGLDADGDGNPDIDEVAAAIAANPALDADDDGTIDGETFRLMASHVVEGYGNTVSVGASLNLGGLNQPTLDPGDGSIHHSNSTVNNGPGAKHANSLTSEGYIKDITQISIEEFTNIIEKIADIRAENGAEQARVNQSLSLQQNNLVNLQAAHGRIVDVDVAMESTRLARHSVTVQASAAMVAQANQMTAVALTLLSN